MSIVRQYFHPALMAFREEIHHHPDLARDCQKKAHSFEEVLGMVGTYVNVVLDGDYNAIDLMDLLTNELKKKRMPTIFTGEKDERLKAISAILGPDGKPMVSQAAGSSPQEQKEVNYDMQKTLKIELPDGKVPKDG